MQAQLSTTREEEQGDVGLVLGHPQVEDGLLPLPEPPLRSQEVAAPERSGQLSGWKENVTSFIKPINSRSN